MSYSYRTVIRVVSKGPKILIEIFSKQVLKIIDLKNLIKIIDEDFTITETGYIFQRT